MLSKVMKQVHSSPLYYGIAPKRMKKHGDGCSIQACVQPLILQKVDDIGHLSAGMSPFLKDLWFASAANAIVKLWKHRNRTRYDNLKPNAKTVAAAVKRSIILAATLSTACTNSNHDEEAIFESLNIIPNLRRAPQISECYWLAPPLGVVKICTDGGSKGNPGPAGWGSNFKDHDSVLLGALHGGLGEETNYIAELKAITESLKKAKEKGWNKVWVVTDSSAAATACNNDIVHWKVRHDWDSVKDSFNWILISSAYREVNFGADWCANKGIHLPKGEHQWHEYPVSIPIPLERPYVTYYRFRS